eukprot:3098880-Rhodomonas_salina.6
MAKTSICTAAPSGYDLPFDCRADWALQRTACQTIQPSTIQSRLAKVLQSIAAVVRLSTWTSAVMNQSERIGLIPARSSHKRPPQSVLSSPVSRTLFRHDAARKVLASGGIAATRRWLPTDSEDAAGSCQPKVFAGNSDHSPTGSPAELGKDGCDRYQWLQCSSAVEVCSFRGHARILAAAHFDANRRFVRTAWV